MTYLPSSLTSLPVQFLYPAPPREGDLGVLLYGPFTGCVVDIHKRRMHDGDLMVTVRGANHTAAYNPRYVVRARVW